MAYFPIKNFEVIDKKQILKQLETQFKTTELKKLFQDKSFLLSNKDKIYLLTTTLINNILSVKLDKLLNFQNLGVYFARKQDQHLRLSPEGSQIIGPLAKTNILEIDNNQTDLWFRGFDISLTKTQKDKLTGQGPYIILKSARNEVSRDTENPKDFHVNKEDFLGCGKFTDEKILNFLPKERRIKRLEAKSQVEE